MDRQPAWKNKMHPNRYIPGIRDTTTIFRETRHDDREIEEIFKKIKRFGLIEYLYLFLMFASFASCFLEVEARAISLILIGLIGFFVARADKE